MTAPTITGIASNQAVHGTDDIKPFADVAVTHADGDVYVVIVPNPSGQGSFTSESITASGFQTSFGTDWLEFNGTPEAATAGIRQLLFNPSEGAVPPGESQTTSFGIHVEVHVSTPSQSSADETASVLWSEGAPNNPPTIGGTQIDVPVTGTGTAVPFSTVTIADSDSASVTVTVAIDASGQGTFTAASLAASGFAAGAGFWSRSGSAGDVTTAIRQLVFDPAEPGSGTQTTNFTISVDDGDGNLVINQTPSVKWTAPGNAPVITSNGGGNAALVQLEENVKAVTDVNATDANGGALTFGLGGGADDALFRINSNGQLSFKVAPDFENRIDANKDGIYQVKVKVTDSTGLSDTQTINVNVKDEKGVVIDGTPGVDIVNKNRTVTGEKRPTEEGDTIHGKAKNDELSGLGGADVILGDDGDDVLMGGDSDFILVGGDTKRGFDLLNGGAGNDTADYSDKSATGFLIGSKGIVATLNGAKVATVFEETTISLGLITHVTRVVEDHIVNIENVIGGKGHDKLTGDGKDNKLFGGAGNDVLRGNGGLDLLDGGAGVDWVDLSNETRKLKITAGGAIVGDDVIDVFKDIENVIGGSKDDRFVGSSENNTFEGRGGQDTFVVSGGRDYFDGGAGVADTAAYLTSNKKVEIDLSDTIGVTDLVDVKVGGQQKDQIVHVENLVGGAAGDVLTGDGRTNGLSGEEGNDRLNGGFGTDALFGGADNDRLNGGLGVDGLEGGDGADKFVFDLAPNRRVGAAPKADDNFDLIADFARAEGDKIVLDKTIFTKLTAAANGSLKPGMFNDDLVAGDGNDFIMYGENATAGILIYDANGNAAGGPGALVIAFVNKGAGITAADILVEA